VFAATPPERVRNSESTPGGVADMTTSFGGFRLVAVFPMIRQFLKSLTTAGFRASLRNVKREFEIQRVHRASLKLAKKYRTEHDLKLNLGCGPLVKHGWINVDLFSKNADLRLDLREPFPLADRSVSIMKHWRRFLLRLDLYQS
jgi:hypothetical protein